MSENDDRRYDEEHSEDVETESVDYSSNELPLITFLLLIVLCIYLLVHAWFHFLQRV